MILRNFGNHFDVLAVQVHQALFERIRFLLYCHKLLLGQLHLIAGALFAILRLNVGGTDDLGSFLLGFLDDVLAKALGIDHGCAQGIFVGTVLVNALGQYDQLFLQVIIFCGQAVDAVRNLSEVIVYVLTTITAHGTVKGHAAHIIRSNHPNSSCFGWHTPGMVSEVLPFGTAAGLPRPMGFTFRFYVQY